MTIAPDPSAVIGIGASAGGVEALTQLVGGLPDDLTAAALIVLHVAPSSTSVLAEILDRRCPLTVAPATHGERLRGGCVRVATPDHHLRVHDGAVWLDREPRVNGHRPAIDPLLMSIALAYGPRGVGVILSGTRNDGSAGLAAIKRAGGLAFVQDPAQARHAAMPTNALLATPVDGTLRVAELGARLGLIDLGR